VADVAGFFLAQERLSEIPDLQTLLIEAVPSQGRIDYFLHTPLARRANDALARVLCVRLQRLHPTLPPAVSVVADLGLALYVRGAAELGPDDFRRLLSAEGFEGELAEATAGGPALRQRFQRVALTALMLLRNPLGRKRRVGGPAWGERRLFDQVAAANPDFVLLRQARREVHDEVCDAVAAHDYVAQLPRLAVRLRRLARPGPFVEGWTQTWTVVAEPAEGPEEVLRRLHESLMGGPQPGP
jgi:ATP-dependent Lhr-like helicase